MLQVAESNLLGRGTPLNFPEARQWARKAWEKGDLRGGHYLAQAYLLDPNNRHIVNGKVDRSKYEALAHRELAQRADQIEALDALAASAQSGFVPSRILLAFVLYEQSGGAPAEKIVTLLASIKDLPANAQKVLSSSRQVIALGATRASPRLLADSLTIAAMGATAQAKSGGVKDVKECKDFRLMKISNVTPIQDVEWLPLKQELVAHTYPLKGFWTEDWNVNLCNTSYTV